MTECLKRKIDNAEQGNIYMLKQDLKYSYFSAKTYVVGTQKNRLNETVLLSTQNIIMLKLMGK